MRANLRPGAAVAALLIMAGLPAAAQDGPPLPRPPDLEFVTAPAQGAYSADELDAMLGPFALFPDALLTQILVASTFPLDLVRADRWIADNAALAPDARSAAAEAEGWDPSVAVLAAGFPEVVQRMAADLDGTEALGDAVLVQTDDVLEAVQRLRGQAQAAGALASNEAQTVTVSEGAIAIAPANPEVVYVPSYDPAVVYAAPVGPQYGTTVPVYGDGYDTNDLLMTGVVAFGGALLIDEIFDDDDDWHGYWDDDDVHIDWDDGDFYPRPDVDIEGDVNIDRDRVVIDGDRGPIDADRAEAARDRLGARDPDGPRREGAWSPDPERQTAARAKLESRPGAAGRERTEAAEVLRGGGAAAAAAGGGAARAKIEASSARRAPSAARKPSYDNAFKPQVSGGSNVKAARDRGAASVAAPRAKASPSRQQSISKAKQSRPPVKRASPNSSAFKSQPGGASRARASSSRGRSSGGGRGGGGRRR